MDGSTHTIKAIINETIIDFGKYAEWNHFPLFSQTIGRFSYSIQYFSAVWKKMIKFQTFHSVETLGLISKEDYRITESSQASATVFPFIFASKNVHVFAPMAI